jgi:DNA-binding CsgD family transcriptional regulator
MFAGSKEHIAHLKSTIVSDLEIIIGERDEFNFEHRFFNSICVIIALSYIFRIFLNKSLGIKISELTISHALSFISISVIYYVSRFLKKLELSKILFFSVVLITFSINWFYTGGRTGIMLFYYFCLFEIIVFVFERRFKILIASIILVNIMLLILLEHRFPNLVVHILEEPKFTIYRFQHFVFVAGLTLFIIQIAKTLYRMDKILSIKMNLDRNKEKYEKGILEDVEQSLTVQERKILELILTKKTNKEIADALYISLCTVKTHINNIYKKLGIHNRTTIIRRLNK